MRFTILSAAALSVAVLSVASTPSLIAAVPAGADTSTPTLSIAGRACPGRTLRVSGSGFADGTYQLRAYAGTLSTSTVTAKGGVLSPAVTLALPASMPRTFQVTIAPVMQNPIAFSAVDLAQPVVDLGSRLDPWQEPVTADCFAPGERVSVHSAASPPATASIATTAATVVADRTGKVSTVFNLHPATAPAQPLASFTAQTSRQSVLAPLFWVPGTTLSVGQALYDNSNPDSELLSAAPGYSMLMFFGAIQITHQDTSNGDAVTYDGGRALGSVPGTRIAMLADGNAVIYSPQGNLVWATGTAGTGTNNRLVLRQDGNMVVYTGAGKPLWSSAVNSTIGLPNHLRSYAYIASSRPRTFGRRNGTLVELTGPAVYINGLIKQANSAANLVPSAHRSVYLQRYLNGRWQNMLSRVTDTHGQLAVGFIQPKVFQYRWVAPATNTAAAASSGSSFK